MDEERLVVALEARIRDFERGMVRAERTGTRTYSGLRSGSRRATRDMETDMVRATNRINQALASTTARIGSFSKAFAGGFIGGAIGGVLSGIDGGLNNITKSLTEVRDQARIAGVSLKSFQELKFVATQARVGVDALTDGLKELNLRSDEFISSGGKSGSAAEAFKRLGISAEDLRDKLKDPSALFTEIIGKLGKFQKASQIRIADEIFGGTGGEQFVKLIDQGADGIRRTIDEATQLGIVLNDDIYEKAEEIDRQFAKIGDTVGTYVKGKFVEAISAINDYKNAMHGFGAERGAVLDEKLAGLGKERLDIERQIFELREKQRQGQVGAGDGILGSPIGQSTLGEVIAQHERRMEALTAEEQIILKIVEARRKAANVGSDETPTVLNDIVVSADDAADAIREAERAARDAQRQFDTFAGTADRLAEALYPGEYARREAETLMADLQKYGEQLDTFQRAAVGQRISDQLAAARIGVRELEKTSKGSFKEMGDTFQSEVGDIFTDVFGGGVKSLDEFVDRVLDGFARIGQANVESLFDDLFSGGKGASVNSGQGASAVGQIGNFFSSIFTDRKMITAQNRAISVASSKIPARPLVNAMSGIGDAVAQTTSTIKSSISAYAGAIQQIESGGNYGAMGPVTKRGDRAYGAYQVMGGNIPSWTKELLGYSVTSQQFLKSQAIQDGVFQQQFGKSLDKFGNFTDAAAVWFSGQPLSVSKNRSDGFNTVAQYVKKANGALGDPEIITGAVASGAEAGFKGAMSNDQWAGLRTVTGSTPGAAPAAGSGMTFGGFASAALGGFGMGVQSENPGMGALSGLMGGLATGNPLMAGVGAIAGPICGRIKHNRRSDDVSNKRLLAA